jgi:hypothetical protein
MRHRRGFISHDVYCRIIAIYYIVDTAAVTRCDNRQNPDRRSKGARIWRMTSTITRWAPCTPVSERGSPATPAAAAKKAKCAAERAGLRHDRRKTSQDHQARGGRPSAGQQIRDRRFAGDQDAVRHDQGGRAEGQRRLAGARTSPVRCGGRGGDEKFRRPDTTANPGRDGRREHRGGRCGENVIANFVAATHSAGLRRNPQ